MTLDEVISYNRLFADMETKSGDLEVAEYYRDTAKCLEELKELREQIAEYKRLLKAAVEDLSCGGENNKCTKSCKTCTYNSIKGYGCRYFGEYHWRYAAEALALIGGETDEQI